MNLSRRETRLRIPEKVKLVSLLSKIHLSISSVYEVSMLEQMT